MIRCLLPDDRSPVRRLGIRIVRSRREEKDATNRREVPEYPALRLSGKNFVRKHEFGNKFEVPGVTRTAMMRSDQRHALFSGDAETVLLPQGNVDLGSPFIAFFQNCLGFIPNHILAQTRLPRLIEAEFQISRAFLFRERALIRRQKELILLAVAAAYENRYTAAMHYQMLRSLGLERGQLDRILIDYRQADLSELETALLNFALRLGRHPTWVTSTDIEELRTHGLADEHILEAVLTTSWAGYLCSLSTGLQVKPNFGPPHIPSAAVRRTTFQRPSPRKLGEASGPYIRGVKLEPESFPPFARVRKRWGFIPNLFQAQTLWPDLVEAELHALNLWLNTGDVLSQRQKEFIFLAISAANLNTYCVAAHCEILRGLGVSEEEADQIAVDHHHANLSQADKVLLDVCLKLARHPAVFSRTDMARLREHGFSELQILETVAIAAITNLINTLNKGLGVVPDHEFRIRLGERITHPSSLSDNLMEERIGRPPPQDTPQEDADAACVVQIQAGDSAAFEQLVRRHGRRVYRTLAGILRQTEDIEDAVQDTFVKAFQHIGEFQGRSRFSTWLTRIAVNTGLQRLRGRKELESLDAKPGALEEYRPRQLQAWQENPEQLYSKEETRQLILEALMKLPLKYRVVVMLRDLQKLSTAETACALGLEIPGVKARLFRGRLMLREALAPYFVRESAKRTHD